jgi:antitoxin VapB
MSLNHRPAQELSKATGETMTEAVTVALRERIPRLRRSRKADATAAELLAIGTRCAASLKGRPLAQATLLHDENGLPK